MDSRYRLWCCWMVFMAFCVLVALMDRVAGKLVFVMYLTLARAEEKTFKWISKKKILQKVCFLNGSEFG